MATVYIYDQRNFEKGLSAFRRECNKEEIISTAREHMRFESKRTKLRKKRRKAIERRRKRVTYGRRSGKGV